jgi:hypothetical protein
MPCFKLARLSQEFGEMADMAGMAENAACESHYEYL